MATRTQARNAVIGILYAYDLGNEDALKNAKEILEEKRIRHKQQEFALCLTLGVVEQKDALDSLISAHLKEWDIERLGNIERAILRLGAYEMCYQKTDVPIVINEAIELSKAYGDDNAPKLINGVLDSLQKALKDKDLQEYLNEIKATQSALKQARLNASQARVESTQDSKRRQDSKHKNVASKKPKDPKQQKSIHNSNQSKNTTPKRTQSPKPYKSFKRAESTKPKNP